MADTMAISKFVPVYNGVNFDQWMKLFETSMVELDRWRFFLADPPADLEALSAEARAALDPAALQAREVLEAAKKQLQAEFHTMEVKAFGNLYMALPPDDRILIEQFRGHPGCAKTAWTQTKGSKIQSGINAKIALKRKFLSDCKEI